MNDPLQQLGTMREARREASLGKVAAAKRLHDAALAVCQQAHDQLEAARRWRSELLARCALGAAPTLRASTLPACEALVQQRQQAFARTQAELRSAFEHLARERQALATRERELLRLQEWKTLRQAEARRESARQDNLLDDELIAPPAHRGRSA